MTKFTLTAFAIAGFVLFLFNVSSSVKHDRSSSNDNAAEGSVVTQNEQEPQQSEFSSQKHIEAWLRGDDLSDAEKQPPKDHLIPTSESIAMFENRIKKSPKDPRNYVMLGRLNLRFAKESDDFSKFVEAENLFRKAIDLGDNKLTAHTYLCRALLAQHRFKESEVIAHKVLQQFPGNELAKATRGDALMQLGKYTEAKEIFASLLRQSRNAPMLARMARIHELTGNSDLSVKLLSEAAALQSESSGNANDEAWFYWRLGDLYLNRGELKQAKENLNEALRIAPKDAHALSSLAKVYVAEGVKSKAIECYEASIRSLDLPPIRLEYANYLKFIGDLKGAKEQLDAAGVAINEEAKDPIAGPAHVRERIKWLISSERELPLALTLAKEELSVRQDIYTYDLLAWCQFKNGMSKKAIDTIARAVSTEVQDARVWFHAGKIHEKSDPQQAKIYFAKALEMNPYFDIGQVSEARAFLASK